MTLSGASNPQQEVIDRASSDPAFRDRLLQDPHGAVEDHLGVSLPPQVTIRVIEEQPGEVVLVLPAKSIKDEDELSDRELEEVAGGGYDSWIPSLCVKC